jgi:hypothetical protein
MTSSDGASDGQVSEILPAPDRRRTLLIGAVIVGILATLVGVGVWWRVASNAVHFDEGNMGYHLGAWDIRAGDTRAECYEVVPGTPIRFGFSLHNPTSHAITIKAIDEPFLNFPQTVTMSRLNFRTSGDQEGPEVPFAPITLRPDQQVMFYVTWQVAQDVPFSAGTTSLDGMTMRYRTMGRDFHRVVPFGYWIQLARSGDGVQACQPTHFAS